MKEEKTIKNRKWVIRIAVVFFAAMLILLFFSNTIYNYSLPQVTVIYSSPGQMTTAIKGNGTIEAMKAVKIIADGTHTVESIAVTLYDDVTEGDILFNYKGVKIEDNEELKAAQAALDALLKNEYSKNLQAKEHDYTMEDRSIADALVVLNEAKTTLTLAQSKTATINAATSDLATKKSTLATKEAELTAIKLNEEALTSAVGEAQTELTKQDEIMKAPLQTLTNAKGVLASNQALLVLAQEALAAIPAGDDTTAAQAAVNDAQAKVNQAQLDVNDAQSDVDLLQPDWDLAKSVYDTAAKALADYAKTVTAKNTEITTATQAVADAETKLADAKNLPSVDEATKSVQMAQRSYDDATKALADKKKSDGIQDILDSLEDEDAKKAITDAQKKVDDLTAILEKSSVVAPISGRVSAINVTPGSDTVKGDVMIVIDDVSQGYKVDIPFSIEQVTKGQLVVGMGARQENSWGSEEDDAVIVAIKPDPADPRNTKKITFKLNDESDFGGGYYTGTTINLTLNNRSQDFQCIIPLSAVHEELGKSFVYCLKTQNSPLGERYIAVSVPVTVIARDDTNAAINPEALGEYGSAVITETNDKSFKSGDQVRLAEG